MAVGAAPRRREIGPAVLDVVRLMVEAGVGPVSSSSQAARVAVARLADAAGVDQPAAGTRSSSVSSLDGALRTSPCPGGAHEEEETCGGAIGDAGRLHVEAGVGLLGGEDVLPDRVAREAW